MKQLLITIAALVLVGCGSPEADYALRSAYDLESAKQAIADGANVKAKDDEGWTPLHFAQTKEIAELLIAKGADVNAQTINGETPLHHAVSDMRKQVVSVLIDNGADVNAQTNVAPFYQTPLDLITDRETKALLRKHGGKTKKELEAAGN